MKVVARDVSKPFDGEAMPGRVEREGTYRLILSTLNNDMSVVENE